MKKYLTLLLLLSGLVVSAQKVSLALNLKKDSTYYLKSDNNLQVKQTMQGQDINVNTDIKISIAHKVVAVNDSVYTMQVSYTSMGMSVSAMGMEMAFNSDDKSEATGPMAQVTNTVGKLLKGMLNKPFTMELSKGGRVLGVKNMDALFNGMFSVMPEIPEEQKAPLRAQIEKSFGEKSITNNFQLAFPMLPAQKIGVNDKWTSSNKMEASIVAKVNTTYTLNQITNKALLVTGEGVVTDDTNTPPVIVNGMSTSFSGLSGKITTEYAFDRVTGWIITSKTNETINATTSIKLATGDNITYPMTIVGTLSVKQ